MTYKSNVLRVLNTLRAKILPSSTEVLNKKISQYLLASNADRIHGQGKSVEEGLIGHYAKSTKRFRIKMHREVTHVDLEVSGQLRESWRLQQNGYGYELGFTKYGAKISGYMEEHFGKTIWGITKHDRVVIRSIVKNFFRELKRA